MKPVIVYLKVSDFEALAKSIFKPNEFSRKFEDGTVIDYWPITLRYAEGSIRVFCKKVLYIFEPLFDIDYNRIHK